MDSGRWGYDNGADNPGRGRKEGVMFPDGRRMFSRKTWQCPWCGTAYKDGDTCPRDDEHWTQFTASLRGTDESQPALVGARGLGAA